MSPRFPITDATASDLAPALDCLVAAFADDPITRFLLASGPDYPQRLARFFSLLMRARLALAAPVLVAGGEGAIHGAAMGYATARPPWPADIARDWERFEAAVPGLAGRMGRYDEIAEAGKPPGPHYYLGVIGVDPARHGQGVGKRLLDAFCARSAADPRSGGVYLETANPANVPFYARAGFAVTGQGRLGAGELWCMFLAHAARP